MNKKTAFWIVWALATVIFLAVSLLVPFVHTAVYWDAFAFGLLALAAQGLFFKKAFAGGESVKSRLFGFPILRIGLIYLGLQLAASLVFMAVAAFAPWWPAFLVGIVLAALAGIGMVGAVTARDIVAQMEREVPEQTQRMKQVRAEAEAFALEAPRALQSQARNMAEAVRYSDPVTSPGMEGRDQELLEAVQLLRTAPCLEGITDFTRQLEIRNTHCREHKQG